MTPAGQRLLAGSEWGATRLLHLQRLGQNGLFQLRRLIRDGSGGGRSLLGLLSLDGLLRLLLLGRGVLLSEVLQTADETGG